MTKYEKAYKVPANHPIKYPTHSKDDCLDNAKKGQMLPLVGHGDALGSLG